MNKEEPKGFPPHRTPAPDPVDQLRDEVHRLMCKVAELERKIIKLDHAKQDRPYGGLGS